MARSKQIPISTSAMRYVKYNKKNMGARAAAMTKLRNSGFVRKVKQVISRVAEKKIVTSSANNVSLPILSGTSVVPGQIYLLPQKT